MLSVIFSLYISYTTILAYCTNIRVISLIHVYAAPRVGIEPGASWLQVRSATDCAKAPTQSHEVRFQNLTNENHPKIQGNDEWNSLFQKKNNFLETDYKHAIWI